VQANVELQQAARKVIEDNELLRELLLECGVGREEVERRIKALKEKRKVVGGDGGVVMVVDNGCGGAGAEGGCAVEVDDFLNDLALEPATGEPVDLPRLDPPQPQLDTTPGFDTELLGDFTILDTLDTSEFLENVPSAFYSCLLHLY
jgi:hypothetical protein